MGLLTTIYSQQVFAQGRGGAGGGAGAAAGTGAGAGDVTKPNTNAT
ncbi:MAG TPA: hypothetical protein VEL11_04025 [Candidatus Bathyarchaeia archaeon]|nr:hypothetical protein [Candidatus Bathyarchaeia archaeon]